MTQAKHWIDHTGTPSDQKRKTPRTIRYAHRLRLGLRPRTPSLRSVVASPDYYEMLRRSHD